MLRRDAIRLAFRQRAIFNRRLGALDEHGATFRWKDCRVDGGTRHETMALGAGEIMRRFLLQVLPSGVHHIRHFGLIANASAIGASTLAPDIRANLPEA